ncbi:MAG: hypothetical protein ACYSR4_10490 [Planctomycetota bacterium]|jgi:hypothetical protein
MLVKAWAIIPMIPQMSLASGKGWHYVAGCLYGSESINTVNIKIAKRAGRHLIRINK